jgi:Spy/CpxP family protein refolding chaperone
MKRFPRFFLMAILGVTAIFALAGFRHAGWGAHCRNWSPEQAQKFITAHVDDTLDDLNATDAQRAKVNALKDDLLKDGFAMHQQRMNDAKEMLAIWESANPDAADVHARIDARIESMRAFAHKAADAALELHSTLTPEQRAQLAEKIRDRAGMEQ